MCGIVGQVEHRGIVDPAGLAAMRDALEHRGPDDAGSWLSADGRAGLGHRRLAIVDLTPAGHQPMPSEDERLWLTLNGEIYNHRELRGQLEARGHRFRSSCDAEVVLHGYEEWGIDVLQRLDGMFAFALWDDSTGELLLARDRFGIKPLYYFSDSERMLFASEAKGLLAHPAVRREVDWSALCDFLVYRYVPSPKCIWKGMAKLPPACWLRLDRRGEARVQEYWTLPPGERRVPAADAAAAVDERLAAAVGGHLLSDVTVGSFLSGGYDSSALALYRHRLGADGPSFAIGFDDWPESEHRYAERVAAGFGLEHRSWILGPESLALVRRLAWTYDEPLADISIVPTFAVSHLAARSVKAVLSGEGADEFFCGYTWQRDFMAARAAGDPAADDLVAFYAGAMAMGSFDRAGLAGLLHPDLHAHLPDDPWWFYRSLVRPELAPLQRLQWLDIRAFMGELVLTKVDRASMANSLEVRVPFLDPGLVELLFGFDPEVYFRPGEQKPLLRANLGGLPEAILQRRKQGFVGPDAYYQNIAWYTGLLGDSRLVRDGVLQAPAVAALLAAADHWRLWKVAVLELWYREWLT
ncbi:MAG: asparagine synthase (glutamine-hydrolyzing) [Thermoanaerobaculia bacterium]|nr:asparagine synthase (glutamine-hydrolyzing) [Thermoanaerobaculia bacterium]